MVPMISTRRPRFARTVAPCALAAALALGLCGTAQGRCWQKRIAKPPMNPSAPRPTLVIGDSVLYDAVPGLARLGFEANGMICRRMDQGLATLRYKRRSGSLPPKVILELGANGPVTADDILAALAILGPDRKLVLLTPTDTEPPRGLDAHAMRAAALAYPDRVTVLDWAGLTRSHREWMARDRVHLRGPAGVRGLINLIVTETPWSPAPTLTTGGLPAPS